LAISALALAAYFLPKRWEEHKAVEAPKQGRFKPRFSPAEKARILSRNPGEWLALRRSMHRFEKWLFNGVIVALCSFASILHSDEGGISFVLLFLGLFIFLVRLASQASYPLADARRSGAVEMILSTPLNPWLLIRGQLSVLWRQFSFSFLLIGATAIALFYLKKSDVEVTVTIFVSLAYCVALACGACVMIAVGMWMGLREKTPNSAFFMTMVYVFIPPMLLFCVWFIAPVWWIILFLHAVNQLSGSNFRRLLKNEKPDKGHVKVPPIIPAPKQA
jgi:hypothetical protein